ncbi:uncharacterized protein LOC129312606 [Prosopis cineraria]|uniref:uncharacterized protein LOC129312606 n=1 Tax=Prosopis cineraria TaxID=364024 RepID=UPI00240EA467|nr:uncharacterized protein LOC129312606 [Prosopis cineraria]XP_054811246.1 uncharacterized protein LOC129312606 [Prosopis cineraria]
MEETDSKMWPELIAKAFIDVVTKTPMSEALATWAEASKAKAEAYKAKAERYKGERSNEEATSSSSDYSLAKCVIALDEIGYVHEDRYMKALETLKDDTEWREIFLSLTPSRKQQWLYRVSCGKLAPNILDKILYA